MKIALISKWHGSYAGYGGYSEGFGTSVLSSSGGRNFTVHLIISNSSKKLTLLLLKYIRVSPN